MEFAVQIIKLVKHLKEKRESIISNQIGRSGTSIGANIREAKYAHGTADFISKMQIALKEANETGYWLELLYKTDYINEKQYTSLESKCKSLRAMLVSSINTAKNNYEVKMQTPASTYCAESDWWTAISGRFSESFSLRKPPFFRFSQKNIVKFLCLRRCSVSGCFPALTSRHLLRP